MGVSGSVVVMVGVWGSAVVVVCLAGHVVAIASDDKKEVHVIDVCISVWGNKVQFQVHHVLMPLYLRNLVLNIKKLHARWRAKTITPYNDFQSVGEVGYK